MFELDESRSIDRPGPDVWAVLVDFPNVPRWEDGVLEVRQTSDGRATLGTTFVARRVFGGRESMVDCRIIEWEEGRVATMEIVGGPVRRAGARYVVVPTSDSTCRVEYSISGELESRLAWLTPLVRVMGRRLVRSNLVRLERLVEERAKTPRGEPEAIADS